MSSNNQSQTSPLIGWRRLIVQLVLMNYKYGLLVYKGSELNLNYQQANCFFVTSYNL